MYLGKNFRERLKLAFPVFTDFLGLNRVTYKPMVRTTIATGGAAGAIAVTGILKGDELVSVLQVAQSGSSPYAVTITDQYSQFLTNTLTITDGLGGIKGVIAEDGYINNTGGESTSGDTLIVTWLTWENR